MPQSPTLRIEAAKSVLAHHSTIKGAVAELGTTADALKNLFARSGRGERARDFLARGVAIPEGMRLKGLTVREDANGDVTGRTMQVDRESNDPPRFEPVPEGHAIKGLSTFLGPQGEVRGQWVKTDIQKQQDWEAFWKACEVAAERYKGLAKPTETPHNCDERTLTLYPLGDPHIGMMAWGKETGANFDLKIAERDLVSCVDMLVDRAPASKRAVLCNLGDLYHAQNDAQRTPRGNNVLDVDGRSSKVIQVGLNIMRRLTDRCLQKHEQVDVINVPGNHDPEAALLIALWLQAVYEKEPRVNVIPNTNPYTYIKFGKVLLGFAHGDACKMEALPGIMAADRPVDWGSTEHRGWITGHVHHQSKKDFVGATVESFRTLAPADFWAHHMGYRSRQSLSVITYSEEYGEISRSTVDIKMLRALRK